MTVSAAKKRANYKWERANYKRINAAFSYEEYDRIEDYCLKHNLSKNALVRETVMQRVDRESEDAGQ